MQDRLEKKFTEVFGITPSFIGRAPGRIEFIGNHTDYNEGTVLGASIDKGVWVAVALGNKKGNTFVSSFTDFKEVTVSDGDFTKLAGEASWVNYPLGVLNSMIEFKLQTPKGFYFMAISDLPSGAGLSSSAAIELASLLAYLQLTNQKIEQDVLIKICKHAENNFVGMPCGILDQGVCGYGKENSLVYIECRGPKITTVPLPDGVNFWIFNTHTKHQLVDSFYATRHKECMDAAKKLGVQALVDVKIENIEDVKKLEDPLNKRAQHVVEEIDRVAKVNNALKVNDMKTVGELLTASHRSSQNLFENSTKELDFLVDVLSKTENVYGTRLTGGGFGGAVLAVTNSSFSRKQAEEVGEQYEKQFGSKLDIIVTKTGPGAQTVEVTPKQKGTSSSNNTKWILGAVGVVALAYVAFKKLNKK